jgi:hypothetical protein
MMHGQKNIKSLIAIQLNILHQGIDGTHSIYLVTPTDFEVSVLSNKDCLSLRHVYKRFPLQYHYALSRELCHYTERQGAG